MDQVTLRTLSSLDLPAFRALRLEALRLHPETFVPTHEEEQSSDLEMIARRLRNDWINDGSFILGAYLGDVLIGAIGVRRSARRKHRHKATIWLLYTRTVVRSQGIGRLLLDDAIIRCRREPELEVLQLTVGSESEAAARLYTSVGFQTYGVERHAMKLDNRYIDVTLMALELPRRVVDAFGELTIAPGTTHEIQVDALTGWGHHPSAPKRVSSMLEGSP